MSNPFRSIGIGQDTVHRVQVRAWRDQIFCGNSSVEPQDPVRWDACPFKVLLVLIAAAVPVEKVGDSYGGELGVPEMFRMDAR